ncbi:MAG: hypothetical protein AAF599_15600 [Bacteroidota bacterium]
MKYSHLFLILLLFAACAEEEQLNQRMVAFDEALLPVWYFASQEQLEQAQQAIPVLEDQWHDLQADYLDIPGPRIAWEDTYECVSELMTAAIHAIDYQELGDAKEYLEAVNFELMNLRAAYNIKYAFDKVWEFKLNLDLVEHLVEDYYYLVEPAEFDCLLVELNYRWQIVEHGALAKANDWDKIKTKRSKALKANIHNELHLLTKSVVDRSLEEDELDYEFGAVENVLNQLICLFGNFDEFELKEHQSSFLVTREIE